MSFLITLDGEPHEIEIVRRKPCLIVRIDGREREVSEPGSDGEGSQQLIIADKRLNIVRARTETGQILRTNGRTHLVTLSHDGDNTGDDPTLSEVRAPMPGAIVSINVTPGQSVTRGTILVTIESMKLQTALPTPRDGVVAEIQFREGDTFDKDQILVRLEEETERSANG